MRNVILYLGNQSIDFKEPIEVLYNFDNDTVRNPTAVKTSYTKTISVPSTKHNDIVFGSLFRTDRVQQFADPNTMGVNYNPSKRVPFTIYADGEIYQTGYAKLDSITKEGKHKTYECSLFGGLGDFFYSLGYNDDDTKKTLADLDYGEDLGFTINQDTVLDAWNNRDSHIINFAPVYEGLPDGMSSDKILINTNGTNPLTTTRTTNDNKVYSLYNGYALGTLVNEQTQWQTRDLRSWLQRPVIRMKSIIDACANPANNGGYEVVLDGDFFNSSNPYYNDTYITLPSIASLSNEHTERIDNGISNINLHYVGNDVRLRLTTSELNSVYTGGSINVKLSVNDSTFASNAGYMSAALFNENRRNYRVIKYSSIYLQVIGCDSEWNEIADAGGDILNLTTPLTLDINGWKGIFYGNESIYGNTYNANGGNFVNVFGHFVADGSDDNFNFVTDDGKPIVLNLPQGEYAHYMLRVHSATNTNDYYNTSTTVFKQQEYQGGIIPSSEYTGFSPDIVSTGSALYYTTDALRSNSYIKQETLLGGTSSPADYLLSFCKMFGLHFVKEETEKKVYIYTRENYYTGEKVNLDNMIDRGTPIDITPLTFESKFYDFELHMEENNYATVYAKTNKLPYGVKRIDTGYEFNNVPENLLDGNVFQSAIEVLDKNPYYSTTPDNIQLNINSLWKYDLYDGDGATLEVNYPDRTINRKYINDEIANADLFSKVWLSNENSPNDGVDILLFFKGNKPTGNIDYHLSDDIVEMMSLNGEMCWLYTNSNYDINGNKIATKLSYVPQYGRYIINNAGWIDYSLDFGTPRETYVKESISNSSNIYQRYWDSYLTDLYDVDTKILECNIVADDKPNAEWLRRFYWFDNNYWVLDKISDFNISSYEPVRMKFIKVNNLDAYTDYNPIPTPTATTDYLYAALDTSIIGAYATTNLNIKSNSSWVIANYPNWVNISTIAGSGDEVIALNVDNNLTGAERTGIIAITGASVVELQITQQRSEQGIYCAPDVLLLNSNTHNIPVEITFIDKGIADDVDVDIKVEGITQSEDIIKVDEIVWDGIEGKTNIIIPRNSGDSVNHCEIVFYKQGDNTIKDSVKIDQLFDINENESGGSVEIELWYNNDITAWSNNDWIATSAETVDNITTITLTISSGNPNEYREGTVYTRSDGGNPDIFVSQGVKLGNYWYLSGDTIYTNYPAVGMQEVCAFGSGASYEGISVIDNLASTSSVDALSANQGRLLDESKQDTLESGVNIKTINNQSILGSGNIDIQGGTGSSYTAGSNIDITNNVISVTGITSFTGITNQDVLNALGYTPYNASNPAGFVTTDTTYTAGDGISITGANNTISVTASSLSYWNKTGNTIGTQYNVVSDGEISAFGSGASYEGISVVDNLNSTSSVDALSANMGHYLKDYVDAHSGTSYTAGNHIDITNNRISVSEDLPYLPISGGNETGYVQFQEGLGLANNKAFYVATTGGTGCNAYFMTNQNELVYGLDTVTLGIPVYIDGNILRFRVNSGGTKTELVTINNSGLISQGEVCAFGGATGNTLLQDLYDEIQSLKQRVTDLENDQQ